jgi:hypothetical protein
MTARRLAVMLVLLAIGSEAAAHDSSLPYARWINSLMRPDLPIASCCGSGDQYWVSEYRRIRRPGIAFRAIVISHDGETTFPIDVPDNKVIWDRPNPTGRAIIFLHEDDELHDTIVVCFVPSIGL